MRAKSMMWVGIAAGGGLVLLTGACCIGSSILGESEPQPPGVEPGEPIPEAHAPARPVAAPELPPPPTRNFDHLVGDAFQLGDFE